LVQVSGVAEETVFSALDEGLASGVLETRGDLVGFVSPLYRQVLCEEMNPLRRRRLHARIGNLIADEPGAFDDGRVMEIAQHWMEAGGEVPAERRLAATRGAAKRAAVLEDWHAATLFVEAALAASAGIPGLSPSVQAEMHQEAALAHHRNVDVGPCLHHYDCAAECFRQAQDVRGMTLIRMWELRARFTLASVAYGTLPDVAPLEAHCDEIEPGDPALRARALSTLAEAYWHGRQSDRAAALATEAMVLARQAEDPGAVAQALHVKALVHAQRLELREAVEAWRSALDEARQAKDVRLAGWPLQRLPLALTCLGEIEEAERAAQEAQSATQRELDWGQLSLVLASRSSLALVRGELDAVEGYAREAMRMTRRSGYPWGGAVALSALAVSRTLRGDADAAEDALELLARPGGAFEVPGPGVQLVVRVQRAHAHALVAAAEGRSYDAPPDLEAQIRLLCIAASDVNVLGALCAATETAALCHRDDLVAKLGASLAESAERGILLSNGAVFLLPRILAIADISAGRVGEARTRLAAAAAVAEAIGARVELTRTRLDQALLEAETGGDLQAAQAWAGEALQLGRELGLELIVRRALRCLSQLGDRSHALEVETSLEPLNPQQVRILLALSQGRTDAQTADDLLLSPATLARSLDRLDRAAAAARTGPSVAGDTVVIAVTDLVRSTDLMEERGERAALDLFRAHHARIRACIRRYGGFEIDEMGDGFLVGFHDATKAIAFARSSHAAIRDLAEQLDGAALRLRIGLHAGEPLAREGRKIFGAAVTGAVRICAAAQPDETLVSDRVRTLANAEKETFASRGTYVLKGFREPYELHAVQDSARAELARS
jgi:class 3 adenylate cyclase/tetratricopeptide (TPR) repeat protein